VELTAAITAAAPPLGMKSALAYDADESMVVSLGRGTSIKMTEHIRTSKPEKKVTRGASALDMAATLQGTMSIGSAPMAFTNASPIS